MAERGAWKHRSLRRNVGPPLLLFAGLSAAVFMLAKLRLAEPAAPSAGGGGTIVLGDAYRGETIFLQTCASCHGEAGSGGVGPKLDGSPISLELVRERIENGKGIMPANLVSGQQEEDVVAYVATLLQGSGSG